MIMMSTQQNVYILWTCIQCTIHCMQYTNNRNPLLVPKSNGQLWVLDDIESGDDDDFIAVIMLIHKWEYTASCDDDDTWGNK